MYKSDKLTLKCYKTRLGTGDIWVSLYLCINSNIQYRFCHFYYTDFYTNRENKCGKYWYKFLFHPIKDVDFNVMILKKIKITQYIKCNLPLPASCDICFPIGSVVSHPLIHYFSTHFVKHRSYRMIWCPISNSAVFCLLAKKVYLHQSLYT